MTEVVRSTCPNCRHSLNIPAAWIGRTVRCKHCSQSMLVQGTPTDAAPTKAFAPPSTAPLPTWEPLTPQAPVPHYTPPVATEAFPVAAVPQQQSRYVSAFDTRDRYSGRGRYSGPKNRSWIKYAALGLVFVGFVAGGIALFKARPDLFRGTTTEPIGVAENPGQGTGGNSGNGTEEPAVTSGAFPRRMLAISIHSYLYANPLHNGDSGFALDDASKKGTDAAMRRLQERWKIPNDQYYHLTDARIRGEKTTDTKPKKAEMGEGGNRKPTRALPLKSVVEGTVERFLNTSRSQDRIVIVFCGHVLEKNNETYLVPIEGDFDEVESLIPLKLFFEKVGACVAQEKLVIFDVCRFHPERGVERPHPGPMTETMEKALHDSPEGVSVVTTCSKGEMALELDNFEGHLTYDSASVKGSGINISGSFFLSMIHGASIAGVLSPDRKLAAPGDEIPLERMTGWMKTKLAEVVHNKFGSERTQTLKATLKRPTQSVAYNPSEALPGRFEYPVPPPSADPKSVLAILREIELPPVKSFRDDAPPPSISDVLPFSLEAMKDYLGGELGTGEKGNEFQKAVLAAVEEMRRLRSAGSGTDLPEEFGGETSDRAKEELRKVQEIPARVEAALQDVLDSLEDDEIFGMRESQTKRWQVHYDYVVAQLKLRICYVNQYNLALANVRGGKLPDLQAGQNGYRLTAETTLDKNTPANYKELFADARKTLTEMAKQHPNTPWALLAKSDRTVAIGLRLTGSSVSGGAR